MIRLGIKIIIVVFLISCKSKNKWTCDGNCNDGIGKKIWRDGGMDSGEWKSGRLDGNGKQIFTTVPFSGDVYEGGFKKGLYDGKGIYYDMSEDVHYNGDFKNGLSNGNGREVFGYKHKYPGMFYDGQWKKGLYDGIGTLYWGEKGKYAHDKYVGEWKNGKMHGVGRYYWANGDRYEGSWENEKKQGNGVLIFKNGDTLRGHWDNDYCEELSHHSVLK